LRNLRWTQVLIILPEAGRSLEIFCITRGKGGEFCLGNWISLKERWPAFTPKKKKNVMDYSLGKREERQHPSGVGKIGEFFQ